MKAPGPIDYDIGHAMIEPYRTPDGATSVRLEGGESTPAQRTSTNRPVHLH